jgi:hypothetical protein
VRDGGDVVAGRAEHAEDLLDAGDEPVGRVGGGARGLGAHELAGVLVDGDDVGEGAPGVDAHPDPSPSVRHAVDSTGRQGPIRWQFVPTEPHGTGQPRHHRPDVAAAPIRP